MIYNNFYASSKEFSKHGLQLPKNNAKMRALVAARYSVAGMQADISRQTSR
jgi:hypothetical protein